MSANPTEVTVAPAVLAAAGMITSCPVDEVPSPSRPVPGPEIQPNPLVAELEHYYQTTIDYFAEERLVDVPIDFVSASEIHASTVGEHQLLLEKLGEPAFKALVPDAKFDSVELRRLRREAFASIFGKALIEIGFEGETKLQALVLLAHVARCPPLTSFVDCVLNVPEISAKDGDGLRERLAIITDWFINQLDGVTNFDDSVRSMLEAGLILELFRRAPERGVFLGHLRSTPYLSVPEKIPTLNNPAVDAAANVRRVFAQFFFRFPERLLQQLSRVGAVIAARQSDEESKATDYVVTLGRHQITWIPGVGGHDKVRSNLRFHKCGLQVLNDLVGVPFNATGLCDLLALWWGAYRDTFHIGNAVGIPISQALTLTPSHATLMSDFVTRWNVQRLFDWAMLVRNHLVNLGHSDENFTVRTVAGLQGSRIVHGFYRPARAKVEADDTARPALLTIFRRSGTEAVRASTQDCIFDERPEFPVERLAGMAAVVVHHFPDQILDAAVAKAEARDM